MDHIYEVITWSYNTKDKGSSKEDKQVQPATKSTKTMEKEHNKIPKIHNIVLWAHLKLT